MERWRFINNDNNGTTTIIKDQTEIYSRYAIVGKHSDGEWVKYSDVEQKIKILQAENKMLNMKIKSDEALQELKKLFEQKQTNNQESLKDINTKITDSLNIDKYRFKFGADEYGKYVDEYKNGKRISCVRGINDIEWVKHEDVKGLELQVATLTEQLSKMERAMSRQTTSQNGYIIVDISSGIKNVNITWLSNDENGKTSLRYSEDHPVNLKEVIETVKLISGKTRIVNVACDIWYSNFVDLLIKYGFNVIELKNKNKIKVNP